MDHLLTVWSLVLLVQAAVIVIAGEGLEMEPIWLTVSSLYRTPIYGSALIDREVQLNWNEGVEEVALFTTDPTLNPSPVIHIKTDDYPEGMYQTNYSLARPILPGGWELDHPGDQEPGDHCLNFWIGSYRNDTLEQVECLKIRPTWMSDSSLSIGGMPLTAVLWPGTHNSGCYKRGDTLIQKDTLARYLLTQDQAVWSQLVYGVRYIDLPIGIYPVKCNGSGLSIGGLSLTAVLWPGTHNSGCYKRGDTLSQKDTLARYVLNQDQDVWSQLVYGVRYIDLRVGIYPVKSNGSEQISLENSFWVNHDLIKVRPLVPILREIRQFLQKAKGEIVILDLHRFPVGFSGRHARHNRLVELLTQELSDLAIDFTGTWPSLDTLWQQDKQLIIAYGDNEVAKKHTWLWPPILQQWGNQQTVAGLEEYLECCMNSTELQQPGRGMWAAMAQLTPGQFDLLFNPGMSLRKMAHTVNSPLTTWLRDRWWDRANIITSDYFLGNNVVDIAVAANIDKGNAFKRYDLM